VGYVVGALHEREADHVGMPRNKIEIAEIAAPSKDRGVVRPRAGEAALRLDLEAFALGPLEQDDDIARVAYLNAASQFTIIEGPSMPRAR
jgi:hypothetical protein